jgi:hypothetical protein
MRWFWFVVLMIFGGPVWAIDADEKKPYDWRVVLHFEASPIFTASFRQQLLNDTQAALQPTLGTLGKVEVVDVSRWSEPTALVKAYLETGWPALDAPAFRELTGVKTHIVRLTNKLGTIHIESRQHDGDTGLALPVIRQNETRDPQTLNRLVALILAKDFNPVATVEVTEKDLEFVKIRFRAGAITGGARSADQLVKPGDVFVVSEIYEQRRPEAPNLTSRTTRNTTPLPPLLIARPREYTLLRLDRPPQNGVGVCRVLTRFQDPFGVSKVRVGVRALRLTTIEMPVELKIVDKSGQIPAASSLLQVRASDVDFLPQATARDRFDFRNGAFRSSRPLKNVACVIVTLGPGKEERFPVPLLEGKPVNLRFAIDPKDAAKAEFMVRYEEFRSKLLNILETQSTLAKDLRSLIVTGKNAQALERAVTGLATLTAQDKILDAEFAKLQSDPLAKEGTHPDLLAQLETRTKALREARPEIESKIEDLRKTIDRKNDTANVEKEFLAKEIQLAIRRFIEAGEIPDALEEYDRLYNLLKQEAIKEQKARLETEWKPKNDAHTKARDFVMKTWRSLTDLSEFQRNLESLQEATKTLTQQDDRLGLRNLITALDQTYGRLKELLERLDPQSPTDAATIQELRDFTQELRKIEDASRQKLSTIEKTR